MAYSRHTNLKRLIKLAHKVRNEVETHANHHYKPDTLAGACGTSSFKLMMEARRNGIKTRMVSGFYYASAQQRKKRDGHPHCWIEYDGNIIDITATQFRFVSNSNKVSVIPKSSARYEKNKEMRTLKNAWEDIAEWAEFPRALQNNHLTV